MRAGSQPGEVHCRHPGQRSRSLFGLLVFPPEWTPGRAPRLGRCGVLRFGVLRCGVLRCGGAHRVAVRARFLSPCEEIVRWRRFLRTGRTPQRFTPVS